MRVEVQAEHVVKEAESEADRLRLDREARALRACAHPGVVHLLESEGGEPPIRLILARVPGGTLADSPSGRPLEVVAGLGAAIAATLADLHDLGWAHGALAADHVLLDDRGRPVLCGFGHASHPLNPSDLAPLIAEDMGALGRMLQERIPVHCDRRLARMLGGVGGRRRVGRPLRARHLARKIVDLVPTARLEPTVMGGEMDPVDPGGGQAERMAARSFVRPAARRFPSRRLALLLGVGAAAAALVAGLVASSFSGRPSPVGSRAVPPQDATVVAGADRYVLDDPTGSRLITVIGRWGCGPPRPAALDMGDGWLWVFTGWPPRGALQAAHAVLQRPGSVGLAVTVAGPRCDDLVLLSRSGGRFHVPGTDLVGKP